MHALDALQLDVESMHCSPCPELLASVVTEIYDLATFLHRSKKKYDLAWHSIKDDQMTADFPGHDYVE
jgi:hypothetical protein